MSVNRHVRRVGDTRVALAATLKRPDGTAVNLTGLTVKFLMIDAETKADKVAETATGVTVTGAAAGQVQYVFQTADVDTEGTFHAYFIAYDGTSKDTFPVQAGDLEIVFTDN